MLGIVHWILATVRGVFILPIRLYQKLISPLTPSACRYTPSCSEYAAQAIKRHGVVRGTIKGAWRVMRCNPFGGSGHDPV
jgi:putative membrane protein insertion efficiency factor